MPSSPRRSALAALAAFVAVFAVLAWPWIRVATHANPGATEAADARLIAWILAWVAHALATGPAHLVDAPINHPLPGQLTGSEHFASSQLVFAPVFWLTGNAVLGANAVALVSYPLAAFALERLAVALGCARGPAWVAGLSFALGPARVSGNLQLIQYPNLYLPWVALALVRLRSRPDARRSAALALAFGLGIFSSYYMAVMLVVTAGVWGVLELARPGDGRARFAACAAGVTAGALLVLGVASLPYLHRVEAERSVTEAMVAVAWLAHATFVNYVAHQSAAVSIAVAVLAALGFLTGGPAARRLGVAGLVVTVVGLLLMLGPYLEVGGQRLPLPYAAIAATPARFFRLPWRFVVMMGLGTALLLALALETVRRRLGTVGVAVAALVVPWQSGWTLGGPTIDEMHPAGRDAPVYRTVGEFAARLGAGPLLELPTRKGRGGLTLEPDAMLGSTWHWQPLVTGYTGYPPPHRALLQRTLARLPDRAALDDLIDMTHLRWILLRPAADWTSPSARSRFFELLAGAGAKMLWGDRDWFLVRLDRLARHPEWFAALADGPRPGRSLLGTPLAPLPPRAAARIMGTGLPPAMRPLRVGTLRVRVMNVGLVPWPVAVAADVPPAHTVRLAVGWRALDAPPEHELPAPAIVEFPRDLAPGDSVMVNVVLLTPREPGAYEITAAVEQVGDGTLAGPALRVPMRIVPNEGA